MTRLFRVNLVWVNLVVPAYLNIKRRIKLAQTLDQVVGERIVIVDDENHAPRLSAVRQPVHPDYERPRPVSASSRLPESPTRRPAELPTATRYRKKTYKSRATLVRSVADEDE